ncbi:MAG: hypothetical protein ACK2T5_02400 [Anaerolineales bacterium]|jgi:hypothetical protein
MYGFLVASHNVVRWIVVILGLVAVIRSFWGWLGKKEWNTTDRKIGVFFTSAMDVQLLLGVILYFVFSNWGLKAILEKGMSFVMGESQYRFFGIEHAFYMILAVVFAHLGSMLPKKVEASPAKFKRAALWFFLSFLIILIAIPWWRPLFPGL